MTRIQDIGRRLVACECGATTIEKNVVATLITVVGILAISAIGASGIDLFGALNSAMEFGADAAAPNDAAYRY